MKTQNEVQLIGYLAMDPMISVAVNGSKRAFLKLATDSYRKLENGSEWKKTTWHNIVAWDKKAARIENNFIKGSHVLIEGEIQHCSFYKGDEKRYITQIRATKIMNLDR